MTMISSGDESARNAFRAYLRDESSQRELVTTEEMTAADVLEVRNLADAIARAEEALRAPRSSRRDMFAELAATTDDASGPAVFAAARPTPLPPPPASTPAPPVPPAPRTEPILFLPNDEDAFLQPAGRMRSLADETLDGHRPLPTLELRIQARRHKASWIVGAMLGVLAVVAIAAFAIGRSIAAAPAAPAVAAATTTTPETKAETKVEATVATPAPPPPAIEVAPQAPAVPVMDVRSLPTAK